MATLQELLAMTDQDLLSLAGTLDIDTSGFTLGSLPSLDFTKGFISPLGLATGTPEITISPEARSLVSKQFGAARTLGTESIFRTARELAGGRGLRLEDTPVADPALRAQALFESQLGGQEAQTLLGLSTDFRNFLQRQAEAKEEAIQGRFGRETQRGDLFEAIRQFQQELQFRKKTERETFSAELKQRAFLNRLAVAQLLSTTGIGLAAARTKTPLSTTTITPPDFSSAFTNISLGLEELKTRMILK